MYTIIAIGGKQYKINKGDVFETEKMHTSPGNKIECDILFLSDEKGVSIGNPTVSGKKAVLEVVDHGRLNKINVLKYKAKKRYRKRRGHRQSFTKLKFVDVKSTTKKKSTTTKKTSTNKTVKSTKTTTKKS